MTAAAPSASRLDLNLVRVLVAIYETRSVTGAAERLFVTQPTISYSLSRLREVFQDPLFVRGPGGMAPTVAGEAAYRKFAAALASINSAVEVSQHFTPRSSTRRFRVAMSDIGELIFLPPLVEAISAQAPAVEIEVVQVAADDVADWLAAGKVDLAIGNLNVAGDAIRRERLFTEHYVCVFRRDHPEIGERLTLAQFVKAHHVLVSSPVSGHVQIEEALRQRNVSRKVAVQTLHFTILTELLTRSRLLASVPSRVARLFEQTAPVRSLPLPIEIAPFEVRMFWHEHQEDQPPHRWLRDIVLATLRGL